MGMNTNLFPFRVENTNTLKEKKKDLKQLTLVEQEVLDI